MNNYSIKCFVLEPSKNLKSTITKLIIDYKFIIDKGWENGYHIHLRGPLNFKNLQLIVNELEEGVSDSLTDYETDDFIKRYESTARILKRSDSFKPIFKDTVIVNKENSIFKRDIEDTLFREVSHIFDSYYCRDYFNKNSLYEIIGEAMKFHNILETYEEPKTKYTYAYNCHLSHYIAFINRLNNRDKKSIEEKFKLRFEQDIETGLFDFDFSTTTLTNELMAFYHKIKPLVENKQLNFYMPYNRDHLDEKIEFSSQRHQKTFSKESMEFYLYNDILIANRWVTNALYKRLLLLGLSNLDRFYMNYVIARLIYPEDELVDY